MSLNLNLNINMSMDANIYSYNDELRIFLYNLVRLRNNANITQQEMSALISTSHRNYQRQEKGEAEFSFSQILKISKILKCEVADLYYFKKGDNSNFSELSEGHVANQLGLAEFVNFNKIFFTEYSKRETIEKLHSFAASQPIFINNQLPITIKDCDWEIYNNSADELFPQDHLLTKRKTGSSFKDRTFLVNLCNRLFRVEKTSFYCQFEAQYIVNGMEQTRKKIFYVVRRPNNKIYISGTSKQ